MSELIPMMFYRTGIRLARAGKIKEAAEYFEQKLAQNPKNVFLHIEAARAYFKLNDNTAVKTHLQQALQCNASRSTIESILEITNWRMIAHPKYFNQTPVFSPCGKYIVYASARTASLDNTFPSITDLHALYRCNLSTGTEELLTNPAHYACSPSYSPDGTQLLFFSARRDTDGNALIDSRDNRGLYLLHLNSGTEELLVSDEHKIKHASFSPDGTKIIFYCTLKGEANGNIYLLNLKDKRMTNLTPDDYESTFPSISPNGMWYTFSSWRRDTNRDGHITIRDNSGIYARELGGYREIPIASDAYDNSFPTFSSDSRYIVYLSRRRDTNHDGIIDSQDNSGIYRFDLKRSKEQVLVNDDHYNKYPTITPNGKTLIFVSSWIRKKTITDSRKDYFEKKGIYAMDLVSWKIFKVVNDKYYSSHAPVSSPDSEYIAYTSWRPGMSRGLYMARINKLPAKEGLIEFINTF